MNYDEAIEIADKIHWVGFYDRVANFHCNPYLIIDGDEAVLIDPGSVPHFPIVARKVISLIDPKKIEAAITPRTKAVIPVHLYGQMADMDAVMQVAQKHRLVVIEDAAQAIGAEYKGRRAGSIGHYGCFSFFPSKNLGAAGDGGMVVTQDARRAESVARVRGHGAEPKYYHKVIGGNFRLDTLQAAVVLAKLRHLDAWTAARQRNAERYQHLFAETGLDIADSVEYGDQGMGSRDVILPSSVVAGRHIFNQYVVRTARRDQLKSALQEQGIGTEIYYPVPLHQQECFSGLGYKTGAFPESESAARETLALPIYPELSEQQARYVVQSIAAFLLPKRTGGLPKSGARDRT